MSAPRTKLSACRASVPQTLSDSINTQGIDAELVSLENIIDWDVQAEEQEVSSKSVDGPPQLGQAFYSRLSQRLGERLAECGDRVPVVTGACSLFLLAMLELSRISPLRIR